MRRRRHRRPRAPHAAASNPGAQHTGPHVVVPRGAHVGRALGDEPDRPVGEHGAARRLEPAVGAQDLAGDRAIRVRPRQGRGRLDRAREWEDVGLEDHHHIVSGDLLESVGRQGTDADGRTRCVGPAGESGRPAWVGGGTRPHEHPQNLGIAKRAHWLDAVDPGA